MNCRVFLCLLIVLLGCLLGYWAAAPQLQTECPAVETARAGELQAASIESPACYTYTPTDDLAGSLVESDESYASNPALNRQLGNSYDGINRLKVETITGADAQTTLYDYDHAHNRTKKTVQKPGQDIAGLKVSHSTSTGGNPSSHSAKETKEKSDQKVKSKGPVQANKSGKKAQ